jgi:RNA polymerase sigma-70 factor (ECF subfamily)
MTQIPPTRLSLLTRLRDHQDDAAWKDFVRLYAPVVFRFGRRKGLQDADAADLTQEVLRSVAANVASFDPQRGAFRSWLFTLAHRRLYDLVQRRQRQTPPLADEATVQFLEELPARDDEKSWDLDYERQLFTLAAQRIRSRFSDTSWQAFQLTTAGGKSGQEVAQELGISVAAVYLAKGRIMVKLKEEITRLQEE